MNWIIGAALKVFGSGLLQPILNHLDKKQDGDTDRYKASVSAEIEANRQRTAFASAFPAMVYLTWAPFAIWSAAVMIDTTFDLPFAVNRPPPMFEEWAKIILLAPFIHAPVATVARALAIRLGR